MQTNRKLPRKYQPINRNVLNFRDETSARKKNAVMHILPKNSLMHDHYFLKIQVLSHQYSTYCSKYVVNVLT